MRGAGPVNAAIDGHGRAADALGRRVITVRFRRVFDHTAGMVSICEDLPEEHNRVTLDPILKDAHGIPAPKIHYTISENSRKDARLTRSRGAPRS